MNHSLNNHTTPVRVECQNCGLQLTDDKLHPLQHVRARVLPGEVMPYGQCPDCGAVCHPIERANYLSVAEWLGALTGILGALILALNVSWSGFGFVGYSVSNVFWLIYAHGKRARGLFAMQCVFSVISALGMYRWLVAG